ncbi:peptide/nickel transport system ATP-binding protein [Nitrobacteraceae bacterium AZCC 2161]|jgi:peptide/nickel transport system ATP-binding protein
MALLEVKDLHIAFATSRGLLPAVHGISFSVDAGETVAIVGESGSGKSITAMSLLRLLKEPETQIRGEIVFKGRDLLKASEPGMRAIRGDEISMIFQEPMSALNPVMTVGQQIAEAISLHKNVSAVDARAHALRMLIQVGIPAPERRMREYPHQLSGGMRQRVMTAMALACEPALLIADEPTTALDVTVQAQILDLMRELKSRLGSAIILITHDMGVVAELAQRVIIMYAGRKVEEASTEDIFARPSHPYTIGLLGAIPRLGSSSGPDAGKPLTEIPGVVPSLREARAGCAFAARCAFATSVCFEVMPVLEAVASGHTVACHHIQLPLAV